MGINYEDFKEKIQRVKESNKKITEGRIILSDEEKLELLKKNTDAVKNECPIDILEEYFHNIIYKNGKYKFSRRNDDSTASCYFFLSGGKWVYKDYGDSSSEGTGTIIDIVVQKNKGFSFSDAVRYCVEKLGVHDYYKEALDITSLQNYYIESQNKVYINNSSRKSVSDILKEAEYNAKISKENNSKIEKESQIFSRITYASKSIPKDLKELLEKRGIKTSSKGVYYLKGEYFRKDENDKLVRYMEASGVGVVTANNENLEDLNKVIAQIEEKGFYAFKENFDDGVKFGGDVHIIPYIDSKGNKHKTKSFGVGGITLIVNNPLNKKVVIAESKMDYHATNPYFEFAKNGYNVILANSTNNLRKITEYLNTQNYEETFLLNQFDLPAVQFNVPLMIDTNTHNFKFISYRQDEYKQDPNDLLINGVDIFKRVEVGDLTSFYKQIDLVRNGLIANNKIEENVNKLEILEKQIDNVIEVKSKSIFDLEDESKTTKSIFDLEGIIPTSKPIDKKEENLDLFAEQSLIPRYKTLHKPR